MHKRKYSELLSEEKKQARKRNIREIQGNQNSVVKKSRTYPQFDILAARYKGYLARKEVARMIFLFYWL